MKYLILIYEAEEIWENKTDDEKREEIAGHGALHAKMAMDGVEVSGEALSPTSTAVSVRNRAGKIQISDGPFAETKEQLGGFYLVDVETMAQALEYAAMIPTADFGTVEVRQVGDHSDLGG